MLAIRAGTVCAGSIVVPARELINDSIERRVEDLQWSRGPS